MTNTRKAAADRFNTAKKDNALRLRRIRVRISSDAQTLIDELGDCLYTVSSGSDNDTQNAYDAIDDLKASLDVAEKILDTLE